MVSDQVRNFVDNRSLTVERREGMRPCLGRGGPRCSAESLRAAGGGGSTLRESCSLKGVCAAADSEGPPGVSDRASSGEQGSKAAAGRSVGVV